MSLLDRIIRTRCCGDRGSGNLDVHSHAELEGTGADSRIRRGSLTYMDLTLILRYLIHRKNTVA